MNSPIFLTLEQFNQQVLDCQDDAFTLAIAMVGDEQLACQIVQDVIFQVYFDQGNGTHPIYRYVLQGVILSCRRVNPDWYTETIGIPGWKLLERQDQEVLLLVDMLGKTYQDAAFILDSSCQEIVQYVAMSRLNLTRGNHAEIVPFADEVISE